MRKEMIAGNWKMNCPPREAKVLTQAILAKIDPQDIEVVLAPPFISLPLVAELLKGSKVQLAGQNVASEAQGAYTGEVSAAMLAEIGVNYVIIGHSERRQLYGETDEIVNKKAHLLLEQGLQIIICIGETLEQRERGDALAVCKRQLQAGLSGIDEINLNKIVVAYEPVWAIGTGRTASSSDAQQVHESCRAEIKKMYSGQAADNLRIIYGGSVKPDNISQLMAMPDIDGALVGGASLQADSFASLVNYRK